MNIGALRGLVSPSCVIHLNWFKCVEAKLKRKEGKEVRNKKNVSDHFSGNKTTNDFRTFFPSL